MKSCVPSLKIKVSLYSARVASGARFGIRLGSILGALWHPDGSNMASRALKTAPRRPMEPPRCLLDASRSASRSPKVLPGWLPTRPRRPQSSPRASKTDPGASFEPPRRLQDFRGARVLPGSLVVVRKRSFSAQDASKSASDASKSAVIASKMPLRGFKSSQVAANKWSKTTPGT